ncbi:TAXI family TRAP transporter solute-binding subunit [Salipiger sp. P9]|uniref:TAXI family TRAP transporter solute-binding subunit n=1 Tax=Salipiger pentaromativorans TaxID=2943193 RepID=UPI002157683A|nr:TAXI family TRAP transporter solute-binding subunit [Salipiger pentaromativorans]MCR8547484.1 TAXI family TRAP transporter solute-binding subunit [Salipiger pentaromativorans]
MTFTQTLRQNARAAAAAGLLTLSPLFGGAAQAQTVEFTAGSPGGSWFTQVTGLTSILMEKIPGLSIRVVPGGGTDNPSKIQAGISQIGMGLDFLSKAAMDGKAPYEAPMDKIRTLGGTGVEAQFMVYADPAEARSLEALLSAEDVKWGVTPASTSENLTFQRALAFYGNSEDKIRAGGGAVYVASYADLVSAYGDGQIDVLWGAGEIPSGVAAQVASGRRAAKLRAFPEPLMAHLGSEYGYSKTVIPAGTYPEMQDSDLTVSGMGNIILVSADLPDDLVKTITEVFISEHGRFGSIYAALGNYDPAKAALIQPIPMHPGALAAFGEAGLLD